MMRIRRLPTQIVLFSTILASVPAFLLLSGCRSLSEKSKAADGSFESARAILEKNCVHCHGKTRLPYMPSMETSKALDTLIGPGKWIVPGKPEQSRLFQVVTLADDELGAMPPTGHAINEKEIAVLKQWILDGANVPPGQTIPLTPRSEAPRSR